MSNLSPFKIHVLSSPPVARSHSETARRTVVVGQCAGWLCALFTARRALDAAISACILVKSRAAVPGNGPSRVHSNVLRCSRCRSLFYR